MNNVDDDAIESELVDLECSTAITSYNNGKIYQLKELFDRASFVVVYFVFFQALQTHQLYRQQYK